MTDPIRKCASRCRPKRRLAGRLNASGANRVRRMPRRTIGAGFPEAATETIAALLHLIKLMGGELVLNVAGGETERFERAVRTKIEQYTSPTTNQAARKSGLASLLTSSNKC